MLGLSCIGDGTRAGARGYVPPVLTVIHRYLILLCADVSCNMPPPVVENFLCHNHQPISYAFELCSKYAQYYIITS